MNCSTGYRASSQPPNLATARLTLRPFCLTDQDRLAELLNDDQIIDNTDISRSNEPNLLAWIENQSRLWREGRSVVFAIVESVSPIESNTRVDHPDSRGDSAATQATLIGGIGLEIDQQHHRGELGFWIGKPYRNRGYATEAGRAVIELGFERIGLNKITASHLTTNLKSERVLKKLGFAVEGILRRQVRRSGRFFDLACYGLHCS